MHICLNILASSSPLNLPVLPYLTTHQLQPIAMELQLRMLQKKCFQTFPKLHSNMWWQVYMFKDSFGWSIAVSAPKKRWLYESLWSYDHQVLLCIYDYTWLASMSKCITCMIIRLDSHHTHKGPKSLPRLHDSTSLVKWKWQALSWAEGGSHHGSPSISPCMPWYCHMHKYTCTMEHHIDWIIHADSNWNGFI